MMASAVVVALNAMFPGHWTSGGGYAARTAAELSGEPSMPRHRIRTEPESHPAQSKPKAQVIATAIAPRSSPHPPRG